MHVYLVNMPFIEQEYLRFSEKWAYIEDEYLGANVVHALLLKAGCRVSSPKRLDLADMLPECLALSPDAVVISIMQTSARISYQFVCALRKKGYSGLILVGGWFPKLSWQKMVAHHWPVDGICFVDAEQVVLQWLENPDKLIDGIATEENAAYQATIAHTLPQHNAWPDTYCRPKREAGRKTYRLETSRGCPHAACTFCSLSAANVIRDKWQPLPIEKVLSEIKALHKQFGATRFSLTDDDMLGFRSGALLRAKELQAAIKSLPFAIHFSSSISVPAATQGEILDRLVESGLEQLGVGFESADAKQLRRYNKAQTLEENFEAAEKIVQRGIRMIPGLITFDPFADPDCVQANLHFLFEHLKHYDLNKLTKKLHVISGTPIERLVGKSGLLQGDYLGLEYAFLHAETERIYQEFQAYTALVRDAQLRINHANLAFEHRVGVWHQSVADLIVQGKPWQEQAESARAALLDLAEERTSAGRS